MSFLTDIAEPDYWKDATPVEGLQSPEFWKDAQVMDAPPNTVFDEKNNRTLALPQTLNATETEFLIKRDVDKVQEFFGMQEVGGFGALGLGMLKAGHALPEAAGLLMKEAGETGIQQRTEKPQQWAQQGAAVKRMMDLPVVGGAFQWAAEMGSRFFTDEKLLAQGEKLVARNRQQMQDSGLLDAVKSAEESGPVARVSLDLGQGVTSMGTALGVSALTRNPGTAGLLFGALQKSSVYQEARAAGKTPEQAADISTQAGMMEGALEFVGIDHLIKAMRGNSAVKRFVDGFLIEATQEGSQTAAEEAITQGTGVRDKAFSDTAGDILYSGFLGGFLGGTTNAAVGAFVQNEAQARGMDKTTAAALGKYAAANVNLAKQNMGEFIEKELSPIAKDDESAAKFMTLMQDFHNDKNLIDREKLDPATRAAFDQWVEVFNQSVVAKDGGAQEVEKAFFDMARTGGVAEDVSTANAKAWGKVAEKMGRVWGITPKQWFDLHGPEAIVSAKSPAEMQAADLEAAVAGVEKDLGIGPGQKKKSPQTVAESLAYGREDFERDLAADVAGREKDYNDQLKIVEKLRKKAAKEEKAGGIKPVTRTDLSLAESTLKGRLKQLEEAKATPDVEKALGDEIMFQDETAYTPSGKAKTDSAPFKAWFGDSKVVDESGKPLVVYHGSTANITEFKETNTVSGKVLGEGFYFTPDNIRAGSFARKSYGDYTGGSVYPVYLSVKNPKILAGKEGEDLANDVKNLGSEEVTGQLIKQGYDGIISMNMYGTISEIVVFTPAQIKSVNNRGTFSPTDSNILYQSKGRGNKGNLIIKPLSLRGFVRKNGGIKDTGGDLRAADLHKDSRFKGVINNTRGLSPDAMLRKAQDAGYFAGESEADTVRTLTENDLLQALIGEARGVDTYAAADMGKADRYTEYVNSVQESDIENDVLDDIILGAKRAGLDLNRDEAREVAVLRDQGYDERDALDMVVERAAIQMENELSEKAGEDPEYEIPDVPEIKKTRQGKAGAAPRAAEAARAGQKERAARGGQSAAAQEGLKSPRASVTFRKGQRPIINLFQAADESSLLHEGAHIWLREFQAAAAITKDPRVRRDWGILQKWLKMKGAAFTVEQEEKFARGVEKYFRAGQAPTAEMQPVFDRFKEWLRRIYTSAEQLKVEVSPEVAQVFDKLFGGEFTQREAPAKKPAATAEGDAAAQAMEEDEQRDVAADFEANRELAEEAQKSSVPGSIMDWSSDVFTPASSRLGRINLKLKHIVRRFIFDVGLYSHEDREIVRPFIEKAADTMSPDDYKDFDFALKNRIAEARDDLLKKYGMEKDFAAVQEMLDRIHIEAQDAGMDLGFIENYFPRRVRRGMAGEYLATIRNQPFWGDLKMALHEADPDGVFDAEAQAEFVDRWLRQQVPANKITLARKSHAKERPIDYIKPEWNRFYEDSMEVLIQYIGAMRHGIESRKLFGKSEKEKDASIGHYVMNLVQQGAITAEQEGEVKKILKAVVEPALGMHSWISWARNATYIYTMGSPISTLTQLQDFAYSLYEHKWRAFGALGRSIAGRTQITKQDLGLEDLLAEYQTKDGASAAVKKMFKLIGLTWTDATFADAYIDATYGKLRAEARKEKGHLNDLLEEVYGEAAGQVRADLLAGNMTEDVKYLLFSELSDVRPLSLAEMPVNYLNAKNGRVFYMLKTYVVKQIDVFRREAFDDIFSGDAARMVGGTRRLIGLSLSLALMGMGSDVLKDLLLGRDFDLSDLLVDNMLKLFGFSKFTIYKAKKDSIEEAFWGLITPPIATMPADVLSDVAKISQGDRELAESKVLGHTPLVGKFWYWWYGGGKDKK